DLYKETRTRVIFVISSCGGGALRPFRREGCPAHTPLVPREPLRPLRRRDVPPPARGSHREHRPHARRAGGGGRVPSATALADGLGAPRPTAVDALRSLREAGDVIGVRGRGTFVPKPPQGD